MVGNALHAAILVPYEMWRLSHRAHHKNTGNADRDEIFYPAEAWHHKLILLLTGGGGAWFAYLVLKNAPGRRSSRAYFLPEFAPVAWQLMASAASVACVGCLLVTAVYVFGWLAVLRYYFLPLFGFACWLVLVTFLHHNDSECPWYTDAEWTPLKGSLASVDRDYGWLANTVSHHINLHQIHHLFPVIPHYHLREATAAFRAAFPDLTRVRSGSTAAAFVEAAWSWICII